MDKLTLAKQLNKKYQDIATQKNWKGERTIIEWDNLPKTTQFVWERMAEWLLSCLPEKESQENGIKMGEGEGVNYVLGSCMGFNTCIDVFFENIKT